MYEAIIFDFDGVILDSEPIHYEACRQVLAGIGLSISYNEYISEYLGLSDKDMFPLFLANKGQYFAVNEINLMIKAKSEVYIQIINAREKLPFVQHVEHNILASIKKTNKIAICTGSSKEEVLTALNKLNHGNLLAAFEVIVTSADVELGKPSPEGYLLTAQRLGVLPSKCMVIEDSPPGIAAAKKAGMYVIGLTTSYNKSQLHEADNVFDGYDEIVVDLATPVLEQN